MGISLISQIATIFSKRKMSMNERYGTVHYPDIHDFTSE